MDDGAAVGGRRLSTASTALGRPFSAPTARASATHPAELPGADDHRRRADALVGVGRGNGSHAAYAKVLADFEMLKLCDVIFGPVSSNYEDCRRRVEVTRGYLTQHGACSVKRSAATAASTNSSAKDLAAAALWKHKYLAELKKGGLGSLPPSIWRPSVELFEKTRGVEGMFSECRAQD